MKLEQHNKTDRPKVIDRRFFKCPQCGYISQVYGEQYFDYGTYNYIITFVCLDCKELFEGVVSKMECWEYPTVTRDLADEIICLRCGSTNNRAWSKETGSCPKCNGNLNYSVDGNIKVAHDSDYSL